MFWILFELNRVSKKPVLVTRVHCTQRGELWHKCRIARIQNRHLKQNLTNVFNAPQKQTDLHIQLKQLPNAKASAEKNWFASVGNECTPRKTANNTRESAELLLLVLAAEHNSLPVLRSRRVLVFLWWGCTVIKQRHSSVFSSSSSVSSSCFSPQS